MKAIRITSDFSGYPDGQTERVFRTGEEPDDLDDAYADLLVAKGLAEETASTRLQRAVAPALAPSAGLNPPANPASAAPAAPEKKDATL